MLGDCLERMKEIPEGTVDLIITDLPYGTTSNKWDSVIPMDQLWTEWKRICKPGVPIILFTQQPFTTTVAASNLKQLRTEWIWEKPQGTGFLNANRYPLKSHENILVFCDRMPPYNPQKSFGHHTYSTTRKAPTPNYRPFKSVATVNTDGSRFPTTILRYACEKGFHPTQKPTALLEYLIKTYSAPGITVLDCTMGSGSTGVAAIQTGRSFIGIEKDEGYFKIARERIANAQSSDAIPEAA